MWAGFGESNKAHCRIARLIPGVFIPVGFYTSRLGGASGMVTGTQKETSVHPGDRAT